jgi:hypothetical protein
MPVQTVRQAANQVLEANGSQDTLVIANCLMMEYGVGLVRVAILLRSVMVLCSILQ